MMQLTLYTKVTQIALTQILENFVPQLVCNNYDTVKQNHLIATTEKEIKLMEKLIFA